MPNIVCVGDKATIVTIPVPYTVPFGWSPVRSSTMINGLSKITLDGKPVCGVGSKGQDPYDIATITTGAPKVTFNGVQLAIVGSSMIAVSGSGQTTSGNAKATIS